MQHNFKIYIYIYINKKRALALLTLWQAQIEMRLKFKRVLNRLTCTYFASQSSWSYSREPGIWLPCSYWQRGIKNLYTNWLPLSTATVSSLFYQPPKVLASFWMCFAHYITYLLLQVLLQISCHLEYPWLALDKPHVRDTPGQNNKLFPSFSG